MGRWISQDSLVIAGSPADSQALNRYCYCESCPVGGTDASGHQTFGGVSSKYAAQQWFVQAYHEWAISTADYNAGEIDFVIASELAAAAARMLYLALMALSMGQVAEAAVLTAMAGILAAASAALYNIAFNLKRDSDAARQQGVEDWEKGVAASQGGPGPGPVTTN